ncbi:RNA polymerase sigma factor [bacterium]|nr:RNA polymerase sigma factor [bacterium]
MNKKHGLSYPASSRSILIMNKPPASDAELIRSIIDGNRDDFRILMERYQQKIYAYLYRFLYQNRDAAEDVTQSVFLKVYQNLGSVNPELPFQPWIYRIAHNEAANFLRTVSRKRESQFDDGQWANVPDDAHQDDLFKKEDRELVHSTLQKLKPKYREVIILHYFEEKSYEEIAQILDSSTSSVGTLLRRGRLQMQKLLEKAGLIVSIVFGYLSFLPSARHGGRK